MEHSTCLPQPLETKRMPPPQTFWWGMNWGPRPGKQCSCHFCSRMWHTGCSALSPPPCWWTISEMLLKIS